LGLRIINKNNLKLVIDGKRNHASLKSPFALAVKRDRPHGTVG
jgi:hypothetical protein